MSELAREAGVVRASLLLQFPNGWFDITWDLVGGILGRPFEEALTVLYEDKRRPKSAGEISGLLETFVDVSEKTGRLVPNLRSQMFVWGEEYGAMWRIPAQDWVEEVAEFTVEERGEITDAHRTAAEALINHALDLAGRGGFFLYSGEEKRAEIRRLVSITLDGL
jgi:hypothetical protein